VLNSELRMSAWQFADIADWIKGGLLLTHGGHRDVLSHYQLPKEEAPPVRLPDSRR
jgi:hypothetical protein